MSFAVSTSEEAYDASENQSENRSRSAGRRSRVVG